MKRTRRNTKLCSNSNLSGVEKEGKSTGFCPVCQISLLYLHVNSDFHIRNCNVNWNGLTECADGLNCKNVDRFHYRDFSHVNLANYRSSNVNLTATDCVNVTDNDIQKKSAELLSEDEDSVFLPSKTWSIDINSNGKSTKVPTKKIKKEDNFNNNNNNNNRKSKNIVRSNTLKSRTYNSSGVSNKPLSDIDGNSIKPPPQNVIRYDVRKVSTSALPAIDNGDSTNNHKLYINEESSNDFIQCNQRENNFEITSQDGEKQDKAKADWKLILDGNVGRKRYSGRQKRELKICPAYKKIADTSFAVDAFEFGAIEGVTTYFLTHFHYDHYIGLRKSFNFPLYCTNITANLVKKRIKVDEKYIHILENDKSVVIQDVEVTSFDANHCPGSVILLFRLRNGRQHLHTGDFRADEIMQTYALISEYPVANLYLDTTYFEGHYNFPTQKEVIDRVRILVRELSGKYPEALFVCGTYTIGKEKVFTGIIDELQCKLWCDQVKRDVLSCLEDAVISSAIVDNPQDARVHVLPMGKIKYESLRNYMFQLNNSFSHVFAFRPSGWEMAGTSGTDWTTCSAVNNVTIYGVPYSEHSSYSEICKFVNFLKPTKIIPTVNVGSRRMHALLRELTDSYSDNPKQSTLDKFISVKS